MRQINNVKELCELNGNENFYQFGRSLYKYTACGPWCRLIMEDDSDIYYESDKANTKDINAVALEIGSIVEGSDVEIGPYRLDFPFDAETMWDVVEEINNETTERRQPGPRPTTMKTETTDSRAGVALARLVRPWLLPFAFALEVAALVACAFCLAVHIVFPPALRWGDAISDAMMKLPNLKWYWPN